MSKASFANKMRKTDKMIWVDQSLHPADFTARGPLSQYPDKPKGPRHTKKKK